MYKIVNWKFAFLNARPAKVARSALLGGIEAGRLFIEEIAYLCKKQHMQSRQAIPVIRKHLLWEYDWENIDFSRLATVVIERVIERGTPAEWQEIVYYYGTDKILAVAEKSTRLDRKHKNFTPIYLQSGFIHDPQNLGRHPA